jgi:hypothetical protein
MADGSRKPIKDVKLGDKALATDPTTGRTEAREVTDVRSHASMRTLVELTIGTDAGAGTVVATDEHPFWVASDKRWSHAIDLKPGHTLATADNRDATITGTRSWTETRPVYNLTIDGLHTYHVVAGDQPILVHNEDYNCSPELKAYADRLDQNDDKIEVVSALRTRSGQIHFGHNMNRQDIGAVDWEARQAVDEAGGHHMGCAEIGCINEAFLVDDPVAGGFMETVKFRPGKPDHLAPKAACPDACEPLLPRLGINVVHRDTLSADQIKGGGRRGGR